MNKEEFLAMMENTESDDIQKMLEQMDASEFVNLYNEINETNSYAERSETDFALGYEYVAAERLNRIKRLRSDLKSLDVDGLHELINLLGDSDTAQIASDIEQLGSLQEEIKARLEELSGNAPTDEVVNTVDTNDEVSLVIEQAELPDNQNSEESIVVDGYARKVGENADEFEIFAEGEQSQNLEEEYGLEEENLQSPEIVERNFEDLRNMQGITDEDFFAPEIPEEKSSPMCEAEEYDDIVNRIKSEEYSISDLVSAHKYCEAAIKIQKIAGSAYKTTAKEEDLELFSEKQYKTLKANKWIKPGNFGDYQWLIEHTAYPAEDMEEVRNATRDRLQLYRDIEYAPLPPKDPEFREIKNVLKGLKINDSLFSLKKADLQDDINLFLEQVRHQTEFKLAANSADPITPEKFKQAYADELRAGIVQLVSADAIAKGATQKELNNTFTNVANAMEKGAEVNVDRDSVIGWQAAKQARIERAAEDLGKKNSLYKEVMETKGFLNKIKTLDKKLTSKYGEKYTTAKGLAKSFGWGLAYGAVHSSPVGLAAVASVRLALAAHDAVKDYRKQQNLAAMDGKKLSLGQYIKNNKLRMAGIVLTAAGGVMGGMGIGVPADEASANSASKFAGLVTAKAYAGMTLAGLAAASTIDQAMQSKEMQKKYPDYKNYGLWKKIKTCAKEPKLVAKVAGTTALGFVAGMAGGNMASRFMSSHNIPQDTDSRSNPQNTEPETQEQPVSQQVENATTPVEQAEVPTTPVEQAEVPTTPVEQVDFDNLTEQQQGAINLVAKMDLRELNDALGLEGGDRFTTTSQALQVLQDGQHPELVEKAVHFTEIRVQSWQNDDGTWHHDFKDAEGLKSPDEIHQGAREWQARHDAAHHANNNHENISDNSDANVKVVNDVNVESRDGGLYANIDGREVKLEVGDDIHGYRANEDGSSTVNCELSGSNYNITLKDGQITSINSGDVIQAPANDGANLTNDLNNVVQSIERQINGAATNNIGQDGDVSLPNDTDSAARANGLVSIAAVENRDNGLYASVEGQEVRLEVGSDIRGYCANEDGSATVNCVLNDDSYNITLKDGQITSIEPGETVHATNNDGANLTNDLNNVVDSIKEQIGDAQNHSDNSASVEANVESNFEGRSDSQVIDDTNNNADGAPEAEVRDDAEVAPEEEAKDDADGAPEAEVRDDAEVAPEAEVRDDAEVAPEAEAKDDAEVAPEEEVRDDAEVVPEEEAKDDAEVAPEEVKDDSKADDKQPDTPEVSAEQNESYNYESNGRKISLTFIKDENGKVRPVINASENGIRLSDSYVKMVAPKSFQNNSFAANEYARNFALTDELYQHLKSEPDPSDNVKNLIRLWENKLTSKGLVHDANGELVRSAVNPAMLQKTR